MLATYVDNLRRQQHTDQEECEIPGNIGFDSEGMHVNDALDLQSVNLEQ